MNLVDFNLRKYGTEKVGTKVKGKFRKSVEKCLKKLGAHIINFDSECKTQTINKETSQQWNGIVLKEIK